MKCPNCGTELKDGSLFCPNCGAKLSNMANPANIGTAPSGDPAKKKSGNKTIIGILSFVAILAIAVAVVVVYIKMRPVTIDLGQYVSVEYSGYDSYGSAVVSIDFKQLKKDYKDELKFKGDSKDLKKEYGKPIDYLQAQLTGELDTDEMLSNGDTVTFVWDIDTKEVSDNLNVKLITTDKTFTVEDLEEVKSFDPFEGLVINYEGTAPNGTASIDRGSVSNKYYTESDYYFTLSKTSDLSNGDVITVTITSDDEDAYKLEFIEAYGVMPESVSKDYTVEGLDSWITSLDQIPEEGLAKMQQQAIDVFTTQEADFSEEWTMQDPEYVGSYLLVTKNEYTSYNHNYLYLIYHITVDYEAGSNTGSYDYYYGFSFSDLKLNGDGSFDVDVTHYQKLQRSISKEMVNENGWNGKKTYYFYGYETMDDLVKENVTKKADTYTSETDIEQAAE